MARIQLPQSRARAHRQTRRMRVLLLLAVLAVALCAGAVWVVRTPSVRVAAVAVSGAESVTPAAIEDSVRGKLVGDYLFIIPKDSIFFYPRGAISTALLLQYPALKEVSVYAQDFTTLAVKVAERRPQALWCSGEATSTSCALMDEDGVVYVPAADFSGSAYVHYRGPLSRRDPTGGLPGQYLNTEQYRGLHALAEALGQAAPESAVQEVVIDEEGDVHVHFATADGHDFELLFVLADDGADILDRFTLSLGAKPFTEHALGDFKYLDLRFGDKVYYKLRD